MVATRARARGSTWDTSFPKCRISSTMSFANNCRISLPSLRDVNPSWCFFIQRASSVHIWTAVGKRSSGYAAIARSTSCSRSLGTPGFTADGAVNEQRAMRLTTFSGVFSRKAGAPVTNSYRMAPTVNTSECADTVEPFTCSGAR